MNNKALSLSHRKQTVDFYNIEFSKNANTFITRRNRLTRNEFIRITDEDTVKINLERNACVCGCTYNAAQTFGKIYIADKQKYIKDLTTNFIDKDKQLLVLASPFTKEIKVSSGSLDIGLAQNSDLETEISRFSGYKPKHNHNNLLEVECFIIKRAWQR